jgi:hypothetical protein
MLGGLSNGDVCTHIPQAERATESAVHEQVPASKIIDQEEEPHQGNDCLDNTEDTSCEQGGVGTGDTDRFEDRGRIVVDGVDSGCVLPEKERAAKEEAIANFAVVGEGFERLPESKSNSGLLVLKSSIDSGNFFEHVHVILVKLSDPAQILESEGTFATGHEPTGAFFDEEKTSEHHACWNELDLNMSVKSGGSRNACDLQQRESAIACGFLPL